MHTLADLIDTEDPALPLIHEWITAAAQPCELLPPSEKRGSVLQALQVSTRSPMGAIAYETGGALIAHGWLRFLGSGHPRLMRDLATYNTGAKGYLLIADDAAGSTFAINGGAFGADVRNVHYWAPDGLTWDSLTQPRF
jgi:hypothetical protein